MYAALRFARLALDAVAALLLVVVLALTTAQVVLRYVLGASMPWTEELTRLVFVWLVLIAASRTRHMAIDLVPAALPDGPARRGLAVGATLVSVATMLVLIRYTFGVLEVVAYDRYTALGISVQFLYWSVIVGGAAWIVMAIAELFVRDPEPRVVA